MKFLKSRLSNIIFFIILGLLIIPQTRQPIQIIFNKALAYMNTPNALNEENRQQIENYDWKLINEENGTCFDFNDAKGKVVVVNFWATWCPPCIAEMPSIQKLYDHFDHKEEVVFLLVSNEDLKPVKSFKEKNKYSFDVYKPVTDFEHLFTVKSIPRTYIIDKKGRIVIDKTGAVNWYSEAVIATISDLISE